MGTFIITLGIFALCAYVFKLFWKAVLIVCYNILVDAVDIATSVITATKRMGKAVMYLWKRYKNGKVVKQKVETDEEEVDVDLLPEGLKNELDIHDDVIVKKGCPTPEEF